MIPIRVILLAGACALSAACGATSDDATVGSNAGNAAGPAQDQPAVTLTRLDCGTATIKNFDAFFSDRPGLYERAARDIVDSCYLIRRGDRAMLWDTGFSAQLKGSERDMGDLVARMSSTLVEQLAQLGLKPDDIDIVGISHMHPDHTGQAAQFPKAKLLIGRADYDQSAGKEDPFGPWRRAEGGDLQFVVGGEVDVLGDGSVVALHLPGHTPDHLALLVNLASGPVLLSGDLYHSRDAREKRGVPPFNTDRERTLQSMDRFEQIARERNARVIIQHEPADVAKLPAFPKAAE